MSDWDDGYAKGRADEREHTAFLHEALLRNQLADLHAKVEEMRHQWLDRAISMENSAGAMTLRTRAEGLAYALALINGATDD